MTPEIKQNHERARRIVASWPKWKRDFRLTKYSPKPKEVPGDE